MSDSPKLLSGKAGLKKKLTDKYKIQETDKRALEKSIFLEQVEMFDGKWNKFEDSRGWIWIQEEKDGINK